MKNKKFTYVLGLGVVIIWGLIIFWIIGATGRNDDNSFIAPAEVNKESYNDYALPKDTAHLLLNYRDPFGLAIVKDTIKAASGTRKKLLLKKTLFNWSFIKYSGYMRNPDSKKLVAILTINGKSINMAEGETADKVKLVKNNRDSVKVFFEGKTKFIPLHK